MTRTKLDPAIPLLPLFVSRLAFMRSYSFSLHSVSVELGERKIIVDAEREENATKQFCELNAKREK